MNTPFTMARYGWIISMLLACIGTGLATEPQAAKAVVHDLTPFQDAERVLVNPHKGWYHHFPDNHPNKYQIARDADLLEFPGMDHLYLRLAWAYLEPKEGEFDWAVIDRLIQKWTGQGLGVAFRISCKETSTDRIEQQFATPRWVMEAGAKGGHWRTGNATGPEGPWEPAFGDPVFLAKLDRFLAAFAARYDGMPWLRYVDIGSIGDWGEGHTWAGSRKAVSFSIRKLHVDLHLTHFKRTQLVISDDYVHALNDPAERESLHRHILTNGISYRDDSIMVDGYFAGASDRFTVRSPEFFADAYLRVPTVFELEHYGKVKSLGNWGAVPGSSAARFGNGKNGPDFFRGALELLHATYIGYHGDAREWLTDNPELTRELLNRCGYWLFPRAIELPEFLVPGATTPLTLRMENRGVAPPYAPYELRLKLSGPGTNLVRVLATGCKAWLPGEPVASRYELVLPAELKPGSYEVALGLFDVSHGRNRAVDFALKAALRDTEGFYRLAKVPAKAAAPTNSLRVYFIGNSVTDTVRYGSLLKLAASRGQQLVWGRQMIPGAPLQWLWDHPSDGFTEKPFGYPREAFRDFQWDVVSLQPFDRGLASQDGSDDVTKIRQYAQLVAEHSPDVQIYLYARWPRITSGGKSLKFDKNDYDPAVPGSGEDLSRVDPFERIWLARYTGGYDTTNESRDYFDRVLLEARKATPFLKRPLLVVPVGHTMHALDQRMRAGEVPGYTNILQFYKDGIHLNETGSYLVGCTFFATLFRQDPAGLPAEPYGTIAPDVSRCIQETVWTTVLQHPESGVE